MIGIVTDSNSQIPAEVVERHGIEVVPLTVVVDGVSHAEGVDLDADAFYARFEGGTAPTVSTSQPSPGRFAEAYQRLADAGATEILSIHIGAAVSGTLNSATVAAAGAPVPVRLVDTGTASFGVAVCTWEAADAVAAGADIEAAAAVAEAVVPRIGNVFVVGALDLARAGGRLAAGTADDDGADGATGDDGIPVLSLVDGEIVVVGRAAGVDEAAAVMADHIRAAGTDLRVAVGVADRAGAPLSDALAGRLADDGSAREVIGYRIGPSVGVHTGPGTAGAFFW